LRRPLEPKQFTSSAFLDVLTAQGVRISIDGKGPWRDNVSIERLWRSAKYEEVYLHAYDSVAAARAGLQMYLAFYNARRPPHRPESQYPRSGVLCIPAATRSGVTHDRRPLIHRAWLS